MTGWECAIRDCGETFADPAALLVHQATEHDDVECAVCGETVHAGFFAIQHVFENHSRAEYVRAYDADSAAIRERETLLRELEGAVDLDAVADQLDTTTADGGQSAVSYDD